jgi:8-oxo-dGTP diphosphatase
LSRLVEHPSVGVGGVVIHDGRVLLVKRGKPPLLGRWVVPGGTLELGETLQAALLRELREETGLNVEMGELLEVFERIERAEQGVAYHYVIVDYLCRYVSGEVRAGDDAADAVLAPAEELGDYDLPQKAVEVIRRAFERLGLEVPAALRGGDPAP